MGARQRYFHRHLRAWTAKQPNGYCFADTASGCDQPDTLVATNFDSLAEDVESLGWTIRSAPLPSA